MRQIYGNYNDEDFKVWNILYERQIKNLDVTASESHLEGLEKINFEADKIPHFENTNEILHKTTGWRLVVVPGIVPDYTFFEVISNRRFPATTWLRKMKELDYLEEPDMFHDVFAHAPLLTNQSFVNFLEELGKIGLQYVGNDNAIELLSRVYWFTVEFGLIRENGELKIYGAGILSSVGETKFCLTDEPHHYDFEIRTILNTPFKKDIFQDRYFVIDSFEQLFESIPEIKKVIAEMVSKGAPVEAA